MESFLILTHEDRMRCVLDDSLYKKTRIKFISIRGMKIEPGKNAYSTMLADVFKDQFSYIDDGSEQIIAYKVINSQAMTNHKKSKEQKICFHMACGSCGTKFDLSTTKESWMKRGSLKITFVRCRCQPIRNAQANAQVAQVGPASPAVQVAAQVVDAQDNAQDNAPVGPAVVQVDVHVSLILFEAPVGPADAVVQVGPLILFEAQANAQVAQVDADAQIVDAEAPADAVVQVAQVGPAEAPVDAVVQVGSANAQVVQVAQAVQVAAQVVDVQDNAQVGPVGPAVQVADADVQIVQDNAPDVQVGPAAQVVDAQDNAPVSPADVQVDAPDAPLIHFEAPDGPVNAEVADVEGPVDEIMEIDEEAPVIQVGHDEGPVAINEVILGIEATARIVITELRRQLDVATARVVTAEVAEKKSKDRRVAAIKRSTVFTVAAEKKEAVAIKRAEMAEAAVVRQEAVRAMLAADCVVCGESLLGNVQLPDLATTRCGHIFHMDCLETWLVRAKECPNCRQDLTIQYSWSKLFAPWNEP